MYKNSIIDFTYKVRCRPLDLAILLQTCDTGTAERKTWWSTLVKSDMYRNGDMGTNYGICMYILQIEPYSVELKLASSNILNTYVLILYYKKT